MYLLDTNVVSELRRPRPHGAVLAWLQAVDDAQLFIQRRRHLPVRRLVRHLPRICAAV